MGFGIKDLAKGDSISENEEKKYREIFRANDKDKSGDIDVAELRQVLKKCGADLSDEGAELILRLADLDGSNTLSEGEFIHLLGFLLKAKVAFVKQTGDKAVPLDRKNLRKLLETCGYNFSEVQVAALYPMVDKDNSSKIELGEWMMLATFLRFARIQFLLADSDKDGKLDLPEVRDHLPALGLKCDESVSKRLFEKLDSDGSGDIDFEEWTLLCALLRMEGK